MGRSGRHHFRFRSVLAPKFRGKQAVHANGSGGLACWSNRDTQSDQGVFAGTGARIRSQLQLHPLCHPPCLVACETFDGREASRVHHMEVLPTISERSSMTLDIRDLVWLAFLACEVVERRPAKPRGQI